MKTYDWLAATVKDSAFLIFPYTKIVKIFGVVRIGNR